MGSSVPGLQRKMGWLGIMMYSKTSYNGLAYNVSSIIALLIFSVPPLFHAKYVS